MSVRSCVRDAQVEAQIQAKAKELGVTRDQAEELLVSEKQPSKVPGLSVCRCARTLPFSPVSLVA